MRKVLGLITCVMLAFSLMTGAAVAGEDMDECNCVKAKLLFTKKYCKKECDIDVEGWAPIIYFVWE